MPEENLCSQLEIDEALGCQLSFWIVLLLNRTPWKLLRRSWGLLGLSLDLPFASPELFGVSHKRITDLGSPLGKLDCQQDEESKHTILGHGPGDAMEN